MIEYRTGDILEADTYAVVNPVNCAGVMGAGLAKQFADAYPDMERVYKARCGNGEVRVGEMDVHWVNSHLDAPIKLIVNFPTKKHWTDDSTYIGIEQGLRGLDRAISMFGIVSIGIPKLGCGLGGLDWELVKAMIEKFSRSTFRVSHCKIVVYE